MEHLVQGSSQIQQAAAFPASALQQAGTLGRSDNIGQTVSALPPTTSREPHRDLKTFRACETCRNLKIRCLVDDGSPNGACRKCLRMNQPCVYLPVNRRRKKRADARVGELERKMEKLIGAIQASQKTGLDHMEQRLPSLSSVDGDNNLQVFDLIDLKVMDAPTAYRLFDFYTREMSTQVPVVVFPAQQSAESVRRETPILFLTILSVASGALMPELHGHLRQEASSILAHKVICTGAPSLEVIDSLHLLGLFYSHSERPEERNFTHLIHSAGNMAMDAGIGKRRSPRYSRLFHDPSEEAIRRMAPSSTRTRRTWLGAYLLGSIVATVMRRQHLIRWNAYMDESLEILQSSSESLPSDKWLCHMVRAQHIVEDVHNRFSLDDPLTTIPVSDWSMQVKGFDGRMQKWRESTPIDMPSALVQIFDARSMLFIHEIAMHGEQEQDDDFRPPFTVDENQRCTQETHVGQNTPAHISSLTICLRSIHRLFNAILSIEPQILRAYPTPIFVLTTYAVTAFIKLSSIVNASHSELASIFTRDDLRVEECLDRLVAHFGAASEQGKYRTIGKFWEVLMTLAIWWAKDEHTSPDSNQDQNPPKDDVVMQAMPDPSTDLGGSSSGALTEFPDVSGPYHPNHDSTSTSVIYDHAGTPFTSYDLLSSGSEMDPQLQNMTAASQFDMGMDWSFLDSLIENYNSPEQMYASAHLGGYSTNAMQ